MSSTPPGWYPDPADSRVVRYWDGNRWTDHQRAVTPMPPPPGAPLTTPRPADSSASTSMTHVAPVVGGWLQAPSPRLIRSPADAEEVAAEWMRYLGYADARRTPTGPDGGIDVISSSAVAQVKDHGTSIGRPALQQLQGAALGRATLFFARQGYTAEAVRWADSVNMALFRFDLQGVPDPQNDAARAITTRQRPTAALQPAPVPQVPSTSLFIAGEIAENRAQSILAAQLTGRFSQRETVLVARHTWVVVFQFRVDSTRTEGRRNVLRSAVHRIQIDSITGHPTPPGKAREPVVARAVAPLPPIHTDVAIADRINQDIRKLRGLAQPAARQRVVERLTAQGVPIVGAHSVSVAPIGSVLYPLYVGILQSPAGQRVAVVECVSGSISHEHGRLLTINLALTHHHLRQL